MKKRINPSAKAHLQSAFVNLRVLIGLFLVLAGIFLALAGLGAFSALAQSMAQGQQKHKIIANSKDPLVPNGFDCSKIHELGIDKMENLRAGLIMIACGEAQGGSASPGSAFSRLVKSLMAPLAYGATDVNLITGTQTGAGLTQSETFSTANPDNPNQIVVAYNDSRGPNFAGASVSTDGGTTFTRLTNANGQSPFAGEVSDPVILYNTPTATWFTVWIDGGCGGGGLGGYKSTTPWDPSPASWTHYCVHTGSGDDRDSGWADNNPSSPFYGRMYVSWNDFNVGGGALFVRFSTDNGLTWTNARQLTTGTPFIRNVQITGDKVTGDVYLAGADEGGGGFPHNDTNYFYRSTDGGNTWTNTYTGPIFPGPGRNICSTHPYFACMYPDNGGYWRHEGWGEPAAYNGVVHYVYAQQGTGSDPGDIYYIRSADKGQTFSAPFKLNTDATTRAQWQPNLSVSDTGTLFAVWYDERESTSCTEGDMSVLCYRMWARKSNDNGVTWLPDDAFSDVVTPLPGNPNANISSEYAGDYDYGSATAAKHVSSWDDGRNPINGASQQDAFTDRELVAQAPMAQSASSRKTHGGAGTFDVPLPLTGNVGVECRSGGATNDYQMIINFATSVTVGGASVTSGTGSVSNFSVSGSQVTVNLTGVTNVQRITVTLMNVNDGTHMGDVPVSMGVLVGDVNGNGLVNASDVGLTKSQVGVLVSGSNFREDVNANGTISATDVALVKSDVGTALPP